MDVRPDPPGPDHRPIITAGLIEGVIVQTFPTVAYAHGALTELVNGSWNGMFSDPIEHLYLVDNPADHGRSEWYEHARTRDRYVLLAGRLTVALFDARPDSATTGTLQVTQLDPVGVGASASGVVIPPGVWHSFEPSGDRLLLLNAKTPGYDRRAPDEVRMPMPNERVDFTWSTHRDHPGGGAAG